MSPQEVDAERPVLMLDEHELRCIATDGGIKLLEQLDGGVGLILAWADADRGRASLVGRGLLAEADGKASAAPGPVAPFRGLLSDLAAPDLVLLVLDRDPLPHVRMVLSRSDRAYLLAPAEPSAADTRGRPGGRVPAAAGAPDERPNLVIAVTPIPVGLALEAALGDLVIGVDRIQPSPAPSAELQMAVVVWEDVIDAVTAGSTEDAVLQLRASGATHGEAEDLLTALASGIGAGGLTTQRHLAERIVQDDVGWIHSVDRARWWLVESRTPGAVTITPTDGAGVVARASTLVEELA